VEQTQTYGPQEVCDAARIPRATFQSWVSRRYLPLPPAPGPGRERQFSFLDAVRVSVVAELTRLGISVGIAGRAVGNVVDGHIDPRAESRTALVFASSPGPIKGKDDRHGPAVMVLQFRSMADIEFMLARRFVGGAPAGFVMVDVTAISERTRAALEDPEGSHTMKTWLDADRQ
jgi:hypothetical protein